MYLLLHFRIAYVAIESILITTMQSRHKFPNLRKLKSSAPSSDFQSLFQKYPGYLFKTKKIKEKRNVARELTQFQGLLVEFSYKHFFSRLTYYSSLGNYKQEDMNLIS